MSLVTIIWSMGAAASLTLAAIHALTWLFERRTLAHLMFSFIAVAVALVAATELGMMHSATPEEYGQWVRWFHVPIFVVIAVIVLLVRTYLQSGRAWIAWTIIALRLVVLAGNFLLPQPNFTWRQIVSLKQIQFLQEDVSVIAQAIVGPGQWLATASVILMAIYLLDATVSVWRRGGRVERRKAVVVGGGLLAFVVVSVFLSQMVVWGLAQWPVMVTPACVFALGAMAFELSGEILRSARLTRNLLESEQRLEMAAISAGLGMWSWNVLSDEFWATEKTRELFGLGKDQDINFDRWIALVHPDDIQEVRRTVKQAVAEGSEFSAEYRIRLPNGAIRWISTRGRAELDSHRKPALMRGVARDVTPRRQAQKESNELRSELAHAGRISLLGQLASSLTHELNQPLSAILRNAEAAELLLQDPHPDIEELRAVLADIHKDDKRASEVIECLRGMLKRREMTSRLLCVDQLIAEVTALARAEAMARHVQVTAVSEPKLPSVVGDRVLIQQVLLNLLLNAMDAVGGAATESRLVQMRARQIAGSTVEVSVSDTGKGISDLNLDRLFAPFFTTKSNGMGIGLTISRSIVEAHGGCISGENNEDGRGATFRFTLPIANVGLA